MAFRRIRRYGRRYGRKKIGFNLGFTYERKLKAVRARRYRKRNPTTQRAGKNMKDRAFAKCEYVTITSGYPVTSEIPAIEGGATATVFTSQQGFGLLPIQDSISAPKMQQFVFSPFWYSSETYTTAAGAPGEVSFGQAFGMLPGNDLRLFPDDRMDPLDNTQFTPPRFSDNYEQNYPTGLSQWWPFYRKCLVHGSAVDVTLNNSPVPGQLVVLPVQTSQDTYYLGNVSANIVNIDPQAGQNYPIATSTSLQELLEFTSLPDDQTYAKIKYVSQQGGVDKVRIKHTMLTKKLYNKKTLKDDGQVMITLNGDGPNITNYKDANYQGTQNAQWCWYIAFIPSTPIAADELARSGLTIQVKCTYFCEFADRKALEFVTTNDNILAARARIRSRYVKKDDQ